MFVKYIFYKFVIFTSRLLYLKFYNYGDRSYGYLFLFIIYLAKRYVCLNTLK